MWEAEWKMKNVARSCGEWNRGCTSTKVAGSALNVDAAIELDLWQCSRLDVFVLGTDGEGLGR